MSRKSLIAVILFIILLVSGMVYYEKTRDIYRPIKVRWIGVMKDITSNKTVSALLSHINTGNYQVTYDIVLNFVRSRFYYDKTSLLDNIRNEYPDQIIPVEVTLFSLTPSPYPARCQEYSLAYVALASSFGIETRLVVPTGFDHMWAESMINGIWTHVDSTQGTVNQPKMYLPPNWGNLGKVDSNNPVFAFEKDGSWVDVTKVYE